MPGWYGDLPMIPGLEGRDRAPQSKLARKTGKTTPMARSAFD